MNEEAQTAAILTATGWKYDEELKEWFHPVYDSEDGPEFPRNPIHDLNASFQFVEFLRSKGWQWIFVSIEGGVDVTLFQGDVMHEATSQSLTLAISEAGLRALGLWEEGE